MMIFSSMLYFAASVAALTLNIASSGGNQSSSLLYGFLYEDIYHSGDGGLYGEMLRNRGFQGSSSNGVASLLRSTDYWHPVGGVSLAIDTSSPTVSSSLPYQMRMDVPAGTTGTVGFYNEGFWGFDVDATKRYIASFYMRGNYSGTVDCYFHSNTTGQVLGSTSVSIDQTSSKGWVQSYSATFQPGHTGSDANNTFYFTFDGSQLAGQSVYFNVLSVFKQTFDNRYNGVRQDLADALHNMNGKYIRLPGGNNMEGIGAPYYWKWNETIGPLTGRPGRPGTWGDINTDGFGLLEMMQMAGDLGLEVILGIWAGLYLDGDVVSDANIQPYVDSVMNELEFLLGNASTTYGAQRAALGFPSPFTINWIEIGNEDYLNGGDSSYYAYRFMAFYNAIHAAYPSINLVSTINPNPVTTAGSSLDLHIYGNEHYFVSLFNTFDQASRQYPVFVNEYAATNTGSNSKGQVGAQTLGMSCAEAIFLLGCERNSDIILGSAYGAMIKNFNEAPDTVALIKHTANEVLYTISYYLQKLFADNMGTKTLPVTAVGAGFGPVYWSATANSSSTILKLVNYNGNTGSSNAVQVIVEGSSKTTATLISLTAPNSTSVNNLPSLGGEASTITTTTLTGSAGHFSVAFTGSYEIVVLVV
ncbi:putative alpha-N-arabinofuranosidase A precursor [Talaromyces proteolyticus]|uniref:non-reducing end alpha-L-arabinofuranosidase n=1 Tax=Talaromyces proteolyticus TaxID=1131652 RepID=A0AAD4KKU3_9EURO|nr:putative alpha-N-arabinofuranosidase A precursor [Talaromyces proteolyticus]KAH8692577.1 putative alpha-N-arabinofuranosidase A precursor [Talaromyces proteolyticus]